MNIRQTNVSTAWEAPSVYPAPLPYDAGAYEGLWQEVGAGGEERLWTSSEAEQELTRRAAAEKARRSLVVHYYRIGHTLAFPLPMEALPPRFPEGIAGRHAYPWRIWLSWALEHRWRTLHTAWRHLNDAVAGELFRRELVSLSHWTSFRETQDRVHLCTGHFAACLAFALSDPEGWHASERQALQATAARLLDEDISGWFTDTFENAELPPLHNIPCIVLVRSAALAARIEHPLAQRLADHASRMLAHWSRRRMASCLTEGTAYDGYLMDSVLAWLDGSDAASPNETHHDALNTLLEQWMDLGLPGRPDLHPPLGDVEPQMPFWITPMLRLALRFGRPEAWTLTRRMPLARLPAAGLTLAIEQGMFDEDARDVEINVEEPRVHMPAAVLRSGWKADDALVAMSLPRYEMGHLHADAGSIVLAWRGRCWITDPGYQQYRPGAEREFTLDAQAHNVPVIDGQAQCQRRPRILGVTSGAQGEQHIGVDLTACYESIPAEATVRRDLWFWPDARSRLGHVVVVRDRLRGWPGETPVQFSWHSSTYLGWKFEDAHRARLTDGVDAVAMGAWPATLQPADLCLREGSRGAMTLTCRSTMGQGDDDWWWVFVTGLADRELPGIQVEAGRCVVQIDGKRMAFPAEIGAASA